MISRSFCFTSYKSELVHDKELIRYIVYQKEVCPKTKRSHIQGYVEFKKPLRMKRSQKLIGDDKCHLEKRRGTRLEAKNYCMKTETRLKDTEPYEWGSWEEGGQGARVDLKEALLSNRTIRDFRDNNPLLYCKYRNGIKDIYGDRTKDETKSFRKVSVEYVYGKTGTGKTRYGMRWKDTYKIEGSNLEWWDGYNGEKNILIDEYNNDIKITKLLNILDGYQLRLPIKGSFTYANWNNVIITSNLTPDELHENARDEHRNALFRRIKKIKNLKVKRSAQGNTTLEPKKKN